ncbi:ATP-binding cassette domain-containing protein [Senegalia massiliensis]|uniref:ATP-binding cassette domain-containing protein n=1 Tax=Senegalia massiliensis TaxID=1720316 RepID=A0A845QV76_9CLOT|nr:ATP-binding cassette domain-containing protein [Senegalia massiliensis]NBI05970.1 ATP-binding cassette domain-containing protein [Senegalia massiliensis]
MDIFLKDIRKYYKERKILNIDKLTIEKKKITGIIGPNGAGKSTLINIIAGLDNNFLGQVEYNGKKLDNYLYKNITLVNQKPYLFKRSVYDNIAYPLKIRGFNKVDIKNKVEDMIRKFEIDDLKDKRAHKLSGGESQKVSLARALVFNPKLLLLDEPTSNIDPDSIKIMEREIMNFNKSSNSTVIIITHNMSQAKRMCNKLVYLSKGDVIEDDIF